MTHGDHFYASHITSLSVVGFTKVRYLSTVIRYEGRVLLAAEFNVLNCH